MKTLLQAIQWVLVWLAIGLPLTGMAETAARTTPTRPDFPFTEPQFEQVSDAESLNNHPITALAQDVHGFIWIGTQQGLLRYDGYRLRKFEHKAGDPHSLAGNYVNALLAARDGRIWVGTLADGVSVFDPASERFEHLPYDVKRKDALAGKLIRDLVEDAQGAIWIASDQGLHQLAQPGQTLRQLRHDSNPDSLMDDKVHCLLWDKAGRLWAGGNSGLQRLTRDGKRFETILRGMDVQTLFQAQDGKLWLGTREHGAGWLMPGAAPAAGNFPKPANPDPPHITWIAPSQLSHPWVHKIVQVNPGQIWLATFGGGIHVLNASDGQVQQILRHDNTLPSSLALDDVKPMLLDRSGWLWVGTWGAGLQRMDVNNHALRLLRHSPRQTRGLSHPDIRAMLELADGRLLFGTNGNGIDIIDRQRGLIGGYRLASKVGPRLAGTLPDATVTALTQTPDGAIWAGTRRAGVLRLASGTSEWQALPALANLRVRRFLSGRDGSLWIGSLAGLGRWQQGRFEMLTDAQGKPMQSSVNALAEDAQGRIWIGSNNGLWLYQPGQNGLIAIPAEPQRAGGLPSDYIVGLLFDSRGRLWLSTDKGLERLQSWDGKVARFEHISTLLGEPGREAGANILEDRAGRIWTEDMVLEPDQAKPGAARSAQNQGASVPKMRASRLSLADGMDLGPTWIASYGSTRDGLLLFGGTKGVAIIDPSRYQRPSYLPPLVATELKINGETLPFKQARAGQQAGLTLQPGQRNFAIEFAALDYADPGKNRYQYRLQGYDHDWIKADAEHRSAAYGNLWPGQYRLQVRGSNRLGDWSSHELSIPVKVLPTWWQTWWFGLLALLLLGSALHGYFRWRVARLDAKARKLQSLIDARTADIVNLAEIGRELTATLDTEQAFEQIHHQVIARLDAEVFLIGILDPQQSHIELVYIIEHQQRLPKARIALSDYNRPAVWCVRQKHELIVEKNPDLLHYVDEILAPNTGKAMETIVYLPLLAEQSVIGCLSVQSAQVNAYSKEQLEFLRVLASYFAIALSNSAAHSELAQSHQELIQSHEELADTLHYLKEAQAKLIQAERQQISLDLHDNLSQTMTGILLQLDTAREVLEAEGANQSASPYQNNPDDASPPQHAGLPYLDRAIELARDGITQTRHLLKQLRNKKNQLPPIDLVNALRRDLPRLTVGTAIKVEVEQHGQLIELQATLELTLFRIAQEAVTNALRHSGAKLIAVLLSYEADYVRLEVRDDGRGFDPASPDHAPGIGLLGMRERVLALAGRFEIVSSPGEGTSIKISIPVSKASE
ncbi:MAG: hypothetical protein RL748_3520 [Pseudomonadota bacterium]